MEDTSVTEWVARVTGEDSWRTIAANLNTTHATIQRRLVDNTATTVCEIAAHYNANPIGGLLAAGLVTQNEIDEYSRVQTIENYSDLELAQAIVDRIQQREHHTLENVTELPPRHYAANRRAPEPEEGDDEYHDGP